MSMTISRQNLDFLKSLSKNNNREWFNKNKDSYEKALDNTVTFADALLSEMRKHDNIETKSGKASIFRIYRDVRFSKDKSPYKIYWGGSFKRATKKLRGGYYFQISPGNSLAAGGFFSPNPADTLRIRTDMNLNYHDWKKLLANKKFKETFGDMKGEKIATAPRGFSIVDPAIGLIRHKQFYFERKFSDKEVLSKDFMKLLNETFKNLRPYFNYMSELLTTDANGISLLD